MPSSRRFLFIIFLLITPTMALAWSGEVVGITDGDSITVLRNKTPIKIRLYGIDCPERHQPFGRKAKQFTSDMVFRKEVQVRPIGHDRYGRTIAKVWIGQKSLCEELVRHGFAWHYKKYSSDITLSALEAEARNERLGVWSDPHAMPPWKFRRAARMKKR